MDAADPNDPFGESEFLRVVDRLASREGAHLLALHDRVAFLDLEDGAVTVIVWPSLRGELLLARLRELLELDPKTSVRFALLGGGHDVRQVAARLQPGVFRRRMIQTLHLADDRQLWTGSGTPRDGAVAEVLRSLDSLPPARERSDLERLTPPPPSAEEAEQVREHRSFILAFRRRPIRLTWALLGSLAVAFALQIAWGGSEWIVVLTRMGANTSDALGREWWRLASYAFLHAGPMHIAINGYVLYALGSFVERLLGWQRTAVVYIVAAIAGGLASALSNDAPLSVGASGAIWGLLGVMGALAWRPGKILPERLVGPARRVTLINLALNVAVSFVPQVDYMAHFGGGIAGALLILSGLLTRGVQPLGATAAAPSERTSRATTVWTAFAALALAVFVGCFGWAVYRGQAWRLDRPHAWTTHAFAELGTFATPSLLGASDVQHGRAEAMTIGDWLRDPISVHVELQRDHAAVSPATFLGAPTGAPAPGGEQIGERTPISSEPPMFEERFEYPIGLEIVRRYAQLEAGLVVVELTVWKEAPQPWHASVETILDDVTDGG